MKFIKSLISQIFGEIVADKVEALLPEYIRIWKKKIEREKMDKRDKKGNLLWWGMTIVLIIILGGSAYFTFVAHAALERDDMVLTTAQLSSTSSAPSFSLTMDLSQIRYPTKTATATITPTPTPTPTSTSGPSPTPNLTPHTPTPTYTPTPTHTLTPTFTPTLTPIPTPTPTPPCFGENEDFYFISPRNGKEYSPGFITIRIRISNQFQSEQEKYDIRYALNREIRTINPDDLMTIPNMRGKQLPRGENEIIEFWQPNRIGTYRLLPLFWDRNGQYHTDKSCAITVMIR